MAAEGPSARRGNDLGPVGERVAENVDDLRRDADLSTRHLSADLDGLGRPIAATGITKIESKSRRVDADDLVALAVALGTTPTRLLMPPQARPGVRTALTAGVSDTEQVAWAWADGRSPLTRDLPEPDSTGVRPGDETAEATMEFRRRSRPYSPRERLPGIEQHYDAVKSVVDALRTQASERGVPALVLYELVGVALFGLPAETSDRP